MTMINSAFKRGLKTAACLGATSMCLAFAAAQPANAESLAFTGQLVFDNEVDAETFSLTTGGVYILRSKSYAGGTLVNGIVLPRGGFDLVLTLFSGALVAGTPIAFNDDGGAENVATDPFTHQHWDAYIKVFLLPGVYTVAVSQYDNFYDSSTGKFTYPSPPGTNFTPGLAGNCAAASFCDVSHEAPYNSRTNEYGWQIAPIPEPASWAMMIGGFALAGLSLRRRKSAVSFA